jgi:hypothetical protein
MEVKTKNRIKVGEDFTSRYNKDVRVERVIELLEESGMDEIYADVNVEQLSTQRVYVSLDELRDQPDNDNWFSSIAIEKINSGEVEFPDSMDDGKIGNENLHDINFREFEEELNEELEK